MEHPILSFDDWIQLMDECTRKVFWLEIKLSNSLINRICCSENKRNSIKNFLLHFRQDWCALGVFYSLFIWYISFLNISIGFWGLLWDILVLIKSFKKFNNFSKNHQLTKLRFLNIKNVQRFIKLNRKIIVNAPWQIIIIIDSEKGLVKKVEEIS